MDDVGRGCGIEFHVFFLLLDFCWSPAKNGMWFWVVATQRFFMFIPKFGEMIQFDDHIFQGS